jgi:putative acetyltransferase
MSDSHRGAGREGGGDDPTLEEVSFTLRPAREGDTERMAAAHAAATVALGRAAYDERQVRAWARGRYDYPVGEDGVRLVVAVREREGGDGEGAYDEVLGFGEGRFAPADYLSTGDREPPDGEVRAVYVHPAAARQGVGQALYDDLERAARAAGVDSLGLWASLNAVGFYERQGFERVAERDHEFADEVAATVVEMQKSL